MNFEIQNDTKATLENGFYKITRTWKTGDVIKVKFNNEVKATTFANREIYFQRGALVYALDIPYRRENIKDYSLAGFHDYHCHSESEVYKNLSLNKDNLAFQFTNGKLKGQVSDTEKKESIDVELVPMGKTVLRRITFPTL